MSDDLSILYEDENIIAVDKPEGISSISENDISLTTVHSLLEKKYFRKIFIVHRIDKEVSGLILFARNPVSHKLLNAQFAARNIKKNYICLVHGVVEKDSGRINKPIREFGSGRMGIDEKNGKPSITDFKVVERFDNYSLLNISIITGRRHQIRVHLFSIGHPVVGDLRYGERKIQEQYQRLMLHAQKIEFNLPGNKKMLVESPLPESFLIAIERLTLPQ